VNARLAGLVAGAVEPGVYRWPSRAHPAAVLRELARVGWAGYPLDGPVTDADGFFDACARALAFPGWIGHSWTALADGLADLGWLPARGHVLLWERYGALAAGDGTAWLRAYATLAGATRVRYPAPPLYVLLRGTGPVSSPVDGAPIPLLPVVTATAASVTGSAASVTGSAASVTGSAASRRRRGR
jgi:hypothetical protein